MERDDWRCKKALLVELADDAFSAFEIGSEANSAINVLNCESRHIFNLKKGEVRYAGFAIRFAEADLVSSQIPLRKLKVVAFIDFG